MQWETGDASGGSGGFGGTPAAVGFGDGAGNGQVLQGSTADGIASIVNDEEIWFNVNGGVPVTVPGTTPEPSTALLFLSILSSEAGTGAFALNASPCLPRELSSKSEFDP